MGSNPLDPLGLRYLLDPLGLRRLIDPTGLAGLNEDGVLSPFNPKNPVKQAIADDFTRRRPPIVPGTDPSKINPPDRHPPLGPVPDDEASLCLARTEKTGVPMQVGETEWWWNSFHCHVSDGTKTRDLSFIVNAQMMGTGTDNPDIFGMCAIRDAATGEQWKADDRGSISTGTDATFSAEGWTITRLDPNSPTFEADVRKVGLNPGKVRKENPHGCSVMRIDTPSFQADLVLRQGPALIWGDKGWIDCNRNGAIPAWCTYKSRMQTITGTVTLREGDKLNTYNVESGDGEFDHQTVHNSVRDVTRDMKSRDLLPMLNEATNMRSKWNWYRANLNGGVCLMAWNMWNQNTGAENSKYGALADADGNVIQIDPATMKFHSTKSMGDMDAPTDMDLSFTVAEGNKNIQPGEYTLKFRYNTNVDWNVEYKVADGLGEKAHEAACTVEIWHDGQRLADGFGGQETIDVNLFDDLEKKGFKPWER